MKEGPEDFTSNQDLEPTWVLITYACTNFPIHKLHINQDAEAKLKSN